MQDLGGLGGVYYVGSDRAGSVGRANAINDAGQVVGGAYIRARDTVSPQHAFLWEAGRGMQDLGTLGGFDSEAFGINKKGQVAGRSRTAVGNDHAFLWDARGGMQNFGTLGGKTSEAFGINDIGQVVGRAGTSDDDWSGHAFLWDSRGAMKDLGTLGGKTSRAARINNSGQVVGEGQIGSGMEEHLFLWDATRGMQEIGVPSSADNSVFASGITNAGVVVGHSFRQLSRGYEEGFGAFLYDHGKFTRLGTMIDPALCHDFSPVAANDRGQIAGNGTNPVGQVHAFLLTPVSENSLPSDTVAQQRAPNHSPRPTAEARTEPLASSSKPEVPSAGRTPGRRKSFRYTVTDLGTLGGDTSRANGLNNHGQVVGEARTSGGATRPFLWDNTNGMRDLRGIGRGADSAKAINDAGQVVGNGYPEGGGLFEEHAFLWEADHGVKDLGTLGKTSKAFGINKKGQVVGSSDTKSDTLRNTHAFLWDAPRGMQDLGTLGGEARDSEARCIDDSGRVVGLAWVLGLPAFSHAFLWKADNGMKDLGTLGSRGIASSEAHCINNSGQVVGSTSVPGGYHAFLWDAGRGMRDLGTLEECWSDALAVNNKGEVVGFVKAAGHVWPDTAVLFTGSEVIDLNTVIDTASGWHLMEAAAINDWGQIVGQGKNSAGQFHAFLLMPVPPLQSPAKSPASQSPTKSATPPQPTTEVPAMPEAAKSRDKLPSATQTASDFRTWSYTTGRTVKARFRSAGTIHVELVKEDGTKITVRLDSLKREDRKLAQRLRDEHNAGKKAGSPDKLERMAQPRVSVHSGPGLAHDMQMAVPGASIHSNSGLADNMQMAVPGASIHSNSGLADDMQMAVPGASIIHSSPPPP